MATKRARARKEKIRIGALREQATRLAAHVSNLVHLCARAEERLASLHTAEKLAGTWGPQGELAELYVKNWREKHADIYEQLKAAVEKSGGQPQR